MKAVLLVAGVFFFFLHSTFLHVQWITHLIHRGTQIDKL